MTWASIITLAIEKTDLLNSLLNMSVLHSSNSAANKDMVSKYDKWGYNYLTELKIMWKRRNCSLRAISPFPTMFSKVMLLMCQDEYNGVKG